MSREPTAEPRARDAVDHMQARWAELRPELDVAPMGVIGRLLRLAPMILARCEDWLAPHDLTRAEFDVVSALCRSDRPLSPGDLRRALLFTGPATTKRLRRLEDGGWIERVVNPDDARGFLISPTPEGARRLAELLPRYLEFEDSLLSALDAGERAELAGLLRQMLLAEGRRAEG